MAAKPHQPILDATAARQARCAAGRAFARQWRLRFGPVFERLYGADPHSTTAWAAGRDADWSRFEHDRAALLAGVPR